MDGKWVPAQLQSSAVQERADLNGDGAGRQQMEDSSTHSRCCVLRYSFVVLCLFRYTVSEALEVLRLSMLFLIASEDGEGTVSREEKVM